MIHDILLKLACSPLLTCIFITHMDITFEAYIFGCVSIRAVELLTQVLWLLKFLQKNLGVLVCMWDPSYVCRLIFSKFDSFACASHGTIFDIVYKTNSYFEKFSSILTWCLFGSGELWCVQSTYKLMSPTLIA